jgi:hypothetical protein
MLVAGDALCDILDEQQARSLPVLLVDGSGTDGALSRFQ